jgi:Lon protease-like protein
MNDDLDLMDFDGVGRLFPLPGVVLFPHAVLPLHIFEPRYRQMTADALASDRLITIVQVDLDTDWDQATDPPLEKVGCIGRILKSELMPDGRYNLLLVGLRRVRLVRERDRTTLYRQAELELVPEIDMPMPGDDQAREHLVTHFRQLAEAVGPLDEDLDRLLRDEVSLSCLTDILASALGLPGPIKQQLLNEPIARTRADLLGAILVRLAPKGPEPGNPTFPPPFSVN